MFRNFFNMDHDLFHQINATDFTSSPFRHISAAVLLGPCIILLMMISAARACGPVDYFQLLTSVVAK